jgi:tetratricopeptide (TPR) repeat protein
MRFLTLACAMLVFTISGCAFNQLTPEGSEVQLTHSSDAVRNCKWLGHAKGSDHLNGGALGEGMATQNARHELQNTAATLGADTVHISKLEAGLFGASLEGDAYKCRGGHGSAQVATISDPLPEKVLIPGVPFVSWKEASQINYQDKNIVNPSIPATFAMMLKYWGGEQAVDWLKRPDLDLDKNGWQMNAGTGVTVNELKEYLAKGIPVGVNLPLTPYAHTLYPVFAALIQAGVAKGVDLGPEGPHSGALLRMIPLNKLREIGATSKIESNPVLETVLAANQVVIGYDDSRHVFILHNPSFGPAFELTYASFQEMWKTADSGFYAVYPRDYQKALSMNRYAVSYRERSPAERAAEHYAFGYALSSIGRLREGEIEFRDGLAITGLENGYRHMLNWELALNLGAQERIEDAIGVARQATESLPEDRGPWDFLSKLYLRRGTPAAKQLSEEAAVRAKELSKPEAAQIVAKALPCDFWIINLAEIRGLCTK